MRTRVMHQTNCIWEGKVLPYTYKYRETDILFYIGDIYVGQIFKMGNQNYTTFANGVSVNGLKNLYYASEFLLKMNGYENK